MTQFYRAFEDEHRGSREAIKQRLQIYLPFIRPLLNIYPDASALDVGCGRGEWLETLLENGFNATGVDLDEGMLEACKARNLPALKADALSFLQKVPSNSHCIITGFHIAEHIPFESLKNLVIEAHRVLRPGGLLILETPNSENLIVATQNFYLDPTHERPVPFLLLDFLVKFSGFYRSKILRLQENSLLTSTDSPSLMDVIGGTSPDYAIIAQTDLGTLDSGYFDGPFSENYGLSMEELARRYDMKNDTKEIKSLYIDLLDRINSLETHHIELSNKIQNVQPNFTTLMIEELSEKNSALECSLEKALTQAQYWQSLAESLEQNIYKLRAEFSYHEQAHNILANHVQEFKNSTSWKITAPVRFAMIVTKSITTTPTRTLIKIAKSIIKLFLKHPTLVKTAKKILSRTPAIEAYARKTATRLNSEMAYMSHTVQYNQISSGSPSVSDAPPAPPDYLTEHAKAIYYRLNTNTSQKDHN
jgi:O-antigen chain-terminating methyltransferase